jgi:microsomal dipeptidase-like Zn-dependent dipeptidase
LFVNSFHHQAVCDPGERFRVTARSADGIIEAIESREYKSIIGVQWHPECMSAEDGSPIFSWLVQQAADYRRTCDLHQSILTLDTHCDTPMFFPQGVDFGSRDPRILVDLHKMSEGHQDATIMVCYLPQPQQDETFSSKVDFDVNGPTEYADLIFDKIEAIVEQNEQYLAIARTPADLYANKQQGRKSIMLGIENGLALDGHLERLQHFAQRGIVYMTLCHNGDNDICDSARGNHTHNGISSFGQQVVREMNRLGILVDLSHAGEKSFYDALEMSSQPIVCSHSSCRALCDHPRNLTDDQMRALAAKGGVMQITMYNGFLVKDGEATVLDALRHLEHAIEVMGIDHVGIGTDFDGDGGVRGMANSSELLNFTRLLLARGYSEQDIEKIWGGNFLRVMTQVQSVRE